MAKGTNTPDFAQILELCDTINSDPSHRGSVVAADALYRTMKESSSKLVLYLTLHVIEGAAHLWTPAPGL